jgi:hypothetical protein
MAIDISYYQKISGSYGYLSKNDKYVGTVKNQMTKEFDDNFAYEKVKINTVDREVWISEKTNSVNNTADLKIISKPNETLNVGDSVYWKNEYWLITSLFEDGHRFYTKGYITKTNNTLRFYNKTTISLVEVPCIFSDINLNLQEGKLINLPVGHYLVIIPSGYITKEDSYLRFLLNDSAYKIIGISTVTNGLTKIELIDDQITSDDNRELGIANYYSHQSPTPIEDSISISPTDLTINKGSTKVFTATVTINDVEDETAGTVWLLTNKDGTHLPYCTMTYDNRICTLVASNQISYVGKVVVLRIALEDTPDVFIEKEITITSLI